MARAARALGGLAYPRRYAAAFGRIRRVRELPHDIDFRDAYAFADDEIGITQKQDEIRGLFERVRALSPRVVMEIGLDLGGTFFLWTRAAAPDARLVALDTQPPGALGRWSPFPLTRRAFAVEQQQVTLLMGCDSHDHRTLTRVSALLGNKPIDFLFIDGDHAREGVQRDFDMYSPLVRPGGLIAFHDVSPDSTEWTEGTAQFWREFAAQHETDALIAGGEPGFGIGLYQVPDRTRHGPESRQRGAVGPSTDSVPDV